MACPNINLDSWKNLVAARGENVAYALWDKYDGNVPESESRESIVKSGIKATNALQSPKAAQLFSTLEKNKVKGDAFWNKVQSDLQIPKEQIELLKQYNTTNREELIANMLADYSFAIEIDITTSGSKRGYNVSAVGENEGFELDGDMYDYFPLDNLYYKNQENITKEEYEKAKNKISGVPTQYYSNLTVPGGTNYTENEIATPAITPAIKGHAQFATDNGIGWFRSDDEFKSTSQTEEEIQAYLQEGSRKLKAGEITQEQWFEIRDLKNIGFKTRRILEVQSDLFQKGRDKEILESPNERKATQEDIDSGNLLPDVEVGNLIEDYKTITKGNKFLQLLNKDNNWVTFFVKSIIQDSAKKGYEKVLFPTGNTASKVEGHTTLEEFKKEKENRIKFLEQTIQSEEPSKEFVDSVIQVGGGIGKTREQVIKELKQGNVEKRKSTLAEIEQLKQELERVETEGFGALKPIYNFYENAVANVLKKQGFSPKVITDEYGNTWNEVEIVPEREQQSILFQTAEMPASKASTETLNKVKEAAKKMGIDIQSLADYIKGNPDIDTAGVNGLADLVKGVIAVSQGMEDVALTEEMVHVATSILEQTDPKLITALISKIDRFKIYKTTLEAYKNKKAYQLPNGKPDIRKIKKEAVDKLIAEVIINQSENTTEFPELMEEETRSMIQKWWDAIKDYIRGIYSKTNIDLFESAAKKVSEGEVGGVAADITEGGVFYQVAKNDVVDGIYNTILEKDAKIKLNPASPTDKRHYTFDGQRVEKSVTEKVKEGGKMPERTEFQKQQDEQKRNWGSEGHTYMEEFITNSLIDKDGYKRPSPIDVKIASKLDPRIQKQIESFATELINSYAPGTRFIIEKKVVNEKVRGMLASTVDFIAIEPTADGKDVKVDILDWKFTTVNKNRNEDILFSKQAEWKKQMGEYTKILYNYGIKPNQLRKTRMIPFVANYNYLIPGSSKSGLYMESLEVGKLDNVNETNIYLLPVPLDTEVTGNPKIDRLLASLRIQHEKLYIKYASPEEKFAKNIRLNELAKAIRQLHLQLNFEPLVSVGKTFLINASETFKTFENIDYSKLTKDDVQNKLKDLLEFKSGAEKYINLDDVFLSEFPKEGLDAEGKKTLASLENIVSSTGRMLEKINALQREYVVQLALKEEFTTKETKESILNAEKEIGFLAKTFLEGSKLSAKIIRLASNLILNAKSLVNIKASELINEFGDLLVPLEKEAAAQGKTAFDLIGKIENANLSLIKKIDKKFWEALSEAKTNKNKKFLLENLNVEEYNKLAQEVIKRGTEEINKTEFSTDEDENFSQRQYRISQLNNSLDITSTTFNGYEDYQFGYLYNQAMMEEKHYSEDYKQMIKSEAALKMWNFMTALNKRAKAMGYLGNRGLSFFPLMEASAIQKLAATKDLLTEGKDFFKDLYSVKVNEEQGYSKIDPETNKVKKEIPKLFTRTDKAVHQLSTDLTKVGSLWIKALLEYESSKSIENTLLTLHQVEQAKGHILLDQNGEIIYESGAPKIDEGSNKNADILQTIIDDALYGLQEDLSSVGNIGISKVAEKAGEALRKEEEGKEQLKVSTKKVLNNANKYTQALAVGLKALVALPNYFGYHLQTFVNAGNFYKFGEFEKNNLKITSGIGLSTVDKGLLDLIVPLNEDIAKEKRRELAKEQSYIKWLSTWNFTDIMMITNSFPEKKLQLANALSFNDNSMVRNGKIVNIRQYLKAEDRKKYRLSEQERKALEKTFEERVSALKEKESISKIAKIEKDRVVIPGVSLEELAKYRTSVSEFSRNLNGQMSDANKADYRRDTILKSFMMFKNWIPKQVSLRTLDIQKNVELGEWEYGRARLFVKTWAHLGFTNIGRMRDIINGTDEGLKIMNELLEAKKQDYFKKTGQELEITEEEFYDMVRKELSSQMKELALLVGLAGLIIAAKIAAPPDDEDDLTKNRYKFLAKLVNKVGDEMLFYYNPLSFQGSTSGSIIPSLSLLGKAQKIIEYTGTEMYADYIGDEKMAEKNKVLKYVLDPIPIISQFQKEILPIIDPELAKEMGIRVSVEAKIQR